MGVNANRAAWLGLIILPLLATPSVAEPPDPAGGRFTMSPVEGGFLRLDRQTGAVAMCAKSGSEWACKPVEDQTPSSANNLARLEAENRELKGRVKELEDLVETRPPGPPPPPEGSLAEGPPGGKAQLPTDEEVDQALDYLSRVYKKVREHIRDLDKPIQPDERAEPTPGPTSPPASPPPPAPKGSL